MSLSGDEIITLCAVGDLSLGDSPKMLGIGVRSATRRRGGDYLFADVRENLRSDMVFGNLEGVLSDSGYDAHSFQRGQLRGSPAMVNVLVNAGFTILNVANNHMMQYGPEPFDDTCELLEQAGIAVVGLKGENGWHGRPVVIPVKGKRIGFLGYADPDNYGHEPRYALNLQEHVFADVARLRREVDCLVVSLHWGDEFVRAPSPACREYGRALIDAGADVILGHHPHVIQRIEKYRAGWICYSLGNFVSDMVWNPRTTEGLAVTFDLAGQNTDVVRVEHATIRADFSPAMVQTSLEGVAGFVSEDESIAVDEDTYSRVVRSRVNENRTLGHLFLAKNFMRFPPVIYFKIWENSFDSLIGSRVRRFLGSSS